MKKIIGITMLCLSFSLLPLKMDAALTPTQFNTVRNYFNKAILLEIKAQELVQFMGMVVAHADPSSPLNQNVTLSEINSAFSPTYDTFKADLQTALNNLP